MTKRVKNSLAERRLLLDIGISPTSLEKFMWDSPTGRRDMVTTNTLDLKPQSLTLEMLMETKRKFEEMEVGSLPQFPDYSQIERRILDSMGTPLSERPSNMYFWRDHSSDLWQDQSWPNPFRTHKYEEYRHKMKSIKEAQAAERTRKSYEELFT